MSIVKKWGKKPRANSEKLVKQVGRQAAAASHYSEPKVLPGVDRQWEDAEDSLRLNKWTEDRRNGLLNCAPSIRPPASSDPLHPSSSASSRTVTICAPPFPRTTYTHSPDHQQSVALGTTKTKINICNTGGPTRQESMRYTASQRTTLQIRWSNTSDECYVNSLSSMRNMSSFQRIHKTSHHRPMVPEHPNLTETQFQCYAEHQNEIASRLKNKDKKHKRGETFSSYFQIKPYFTQLLT